MSMGLAVAVMAAAWSGDGGGSFRRACTGQDAVANYPLFPIKIVVPYPAGSIPDMLGRMIGEQLQTQFGKPVVVDNEPAPAR